MIIEVKAYCHVGGNRTLQQREQGAPHWKDCTEPRALFVNDDEASFFRATARHIAKLSAEGKTVHYTDSGE